MLKTPLLFLILSVSFLSCQDETPQERLSPGMYRAELQVSDTEILPFNFKVDAEDLLEIYNADEVILVDEIRYKDDSIYIKLPVFEGVLIAKIKNGVLKGDFVVKGKQRKVPFTAQKNTTRFEVVNDAMVNISGDWETTFSPDSDSESYQAKGVFKQTGNEVTGTFRTETGDYRYLEGVISGSTLKLSTFDGAHAFLFTAQITDSTIAGTFYSGNHYKEPFVAQRNSDFELKSANALTFLKEGYESLAFSFPDTDGKQVALSDTRFKDKVVVVQIMGTWCPNCLDESTYYADYYRNNKHKALEFVSLAFEYAKTETQAFSNIKRLRDRVGITYPILLAQTGSTSKEEAQKKLPMLNHVLSYPTTVFIDKQGKVRKIHTGFNGPATGDKFTEFKLEFDGFINALLEE
ncbi:TlpA family protein disulfide reductase [Bizionia gelidisalsuginis]|uniref:TlpA family protein disulfide reductase n=1 Tax=Bizionia gelidisalsuginis TaxID=291188 RepID=A0ABY3MEN5_9FLAO|nr:TlpA disulfide reductase family protein [Bizionia gelidisalsuginis]TYC17998.1 TlpA family protein disulfide reductase [Bizionia gelidisalsuginis]